MLDVRELIFRYRGTRRILDSVSFRFEAGVIYGLVGANGAGKTTFFNLLLNRLKPMHGDITLDEMHFRREREAYQRQLVFSNDEPHYPPYFSGREWLAFVLGAYRQDLDVSRLSQLIEVFDFQQIDQLTSSYSHGMHKKLSMIINFMVDARCLLFDESMAGIDPFTLRKIYEYIRSVSEGRVMIISSHSKDLIEACVDQIIFLDTGKFRQIANYDDMFKE